MWFLWSKACHYCGREYDAKLAINQAQHFIPHSDQIMRFRKHMDIVGMYVNIFLIEGELCCYGFMFECFYGLWFMVYGEVMFGRKEGRQAGMP